MMWKNGSCIPEFCRNDNRVFAIRHAEAAQVAQMPQCTFRGSSENPDRSGAADVGAFRLADPQKLQAYAATRFQAGNSTPRYRTAGALVSAVAGSAGSPVNTPS